MSAIFARLDSAAGSVPVIARVIVGGMMFFHGLDKLNGGVPGFAEGLGSKGVPLESVAAWGVTLLELVGGLMLVVGLLARVIASLLTVELIFAIILFTSARGLIGEGGAGYERDLAYIVGLLVVVLLGPGRPSLDHVLRLEHVRPIPARS